MKMNLNLTITDEQRNALACLLAGKEVKRLASRDEFAGYVLGMLAGLLRETPEEAPTPEAAVVVKATRAPPTVTEARKVDDLIKAGKDASYARGWLNASRRWFGGRV